jgi:hypothetical protein
MKGKGHCAQGLCCACSWNEGYNQAIDDALEIARSYHDIPNVGRKIVVGGIKALKKEVE